MTQMDADENDTLPFSERVRIAAELLESLDSDRTQLTQGSEDERRRLVHATTREGVAAGAQSRAIEARRSSPQCLRHSRAAAEAGVHDAERVSRARARGAAGD